MNANNNAQVLKEKGNVSKEFVTMQSIPTVGYTPPTLPSDSMSASQSLYPQSYNFPTYDGAPGLANPYSRDSMFSAAVTSTTSSSLPFGDITPPLFGSGMLGTHPYSSQGLLPSRTAPGLLNYGQSGMPAASQPHLFPGASPYGGYPPPLSMPLHPGQSMERYLLSNPAHMMPRFPALHSRPPGSHSLGGYRDSPGIRPPFSTSLLSGAADRKSASHSPLTNVSNGNEIESRGDINGSRKKRKACGHCGPCQRKENCGSCMNCVNRAKGKQICIHRKCEVLKKKPGSTPYTPTQVEPVVVKQEKRKEIDNFSPSESKRSKLEQQLPQGGDLPQGLLHPTLHPNFAEFGDLNRTPAVQQTTGQSNPIQEQTAPSYQTRLPPSNNQPQTDLHQTYFTENPQQQQQQQQQQQEQQEQQVQQQFSGNNRSREAQPDGQPVTEESDFINQALQAIESNISCNPGSEGNNSLSDNSNAALSASIQSQDQSHSQLQSPQQQQPRRTSVQEPSCNSWNPELQHKANLAQSSQMPAQASAQSASSSPGQAQGQQGLPDQLLNNLRKFNTPTSFHGQQHSSPVKDPSKMGSFSGQQPQYGQNPHRLSVDNQQTLVTPKEQQSFAQQGRQYAPAPLNNSNQNSMYSGENMSYPRPSEPNTRVPSYDQSNSSLYNQMFSMNSAQRPYGAQSYPNNADYAQARATNPRFSYEQENFGNKQQNPNSTSPGQYSYSQTRMRPAYPNPGMPPQHGQSQFNPQQHSQNQYHRYPNPQFHSRGPAPEGNRLPNGQWVPQQTSPPQQGISPQLAGAQPPAYLAANRRTSTNQQSNFPPPRHLTNQSGSNSTNSQSPMVPTSSAGGNPTHSPYPGSMGSSLRSPAAIVTPSPASHTQGETPAVNMPHLASSPMATNPLCPTGVTVQSMLPNSGDPTYQQSVQSYRPWHEPGRPGLNYHGHVSHTVVPPDGYKPDPSNRNLNTNHFLAHPGSSPSYPPQRSAMHPGQSGFPGDPRLSFTAARLSHPQTPGNLAENTQEFTNAHQSFTETMNSVLYGQSNLKHPDNSRGSNSVDKSTAESSPADPHSTISPGESGYDSAELSSVVSENLSHISAHGSQKSNERSKNLTEAPVGSVVQQTSQPEANLSSTVTSLKSHDEDTTVSSLGLLPAGAKVTDSHLSLQVHSGSVTSDVYSGSLKVDSGMLNISLLNKNLPLNKYCQNAETTNLLNNSKTISEFNTYLKPRSFSLDCSKTLTKNDDQDSDFDQSDNEDKKVVSLRRYSSQGIGVSEGLKVNHVFKVPEMLKSEKQVFNTKAVQNPFLNIHKNDKCDNKFEFKTSSQSLNQGFTFDTPPQTPTLPRQPSFENLTGKKMLQNYPSGNCHTQNQNKIHMHLNQEAMFNNYYQQPGGMDFRGRVIDAKGQNGAMIKKGVFPTCNCIPGTNGLNDDAPYYTHLGAAQNIAGIRKLFENRLRITGKALRIEKVIPTDKEGKTSHGCPVAKWIIRRESSEEKVLVVCRQRKGHYCPMAVTVVIILLWDGISSDEASFAYDKCKELIPHHGQATDRRCATNEERTCACQGFNEDQGGASFSFGCSWSMYYNGCKYARSVNPNKFKLAGTKNPQAEAYLTNFCQHLSTKMSGLYKTAAPDGHRNQTEYENEGSECRLGYNLQNEGRPFSGFTCCMDFCAHAHKDQHNMENGVTMVLTLTKPENREIGKKPADEQLHVLPLYKLDLTNEDGSLHGVGEKLKKGSIEILSSFRRKVRLRDKPLGNCKQRTTNKKRKGDLDTVVKKRGRKPKRSLSMENLTVISKEKTQQRTTHQPVYNMHQQTPPVHNMLWNPVHQQGIGQLQNLGSYSYDPISSPPPRWPYRRHISTEQDNTGPLSAESNLPSIGSIFSPGSSNPGLTPTRIPSVTPIGLTPPATPAHNLISPSPQTFQFGRRISTQSMSNDSNTPNFSLPLPPLGSNTHHFSGLNQILSQGKTLPNPSMFSNQHAPLPSLGQTNHSQSLKNHPNHPGLIQSRHSSPQFIQNQHLNPVHQNYIKQEQQQKLYLKSYAAPAQIKNENPMFHNPGYMNPQQSPFPIQEPSKTSPIKREAFSDSEESFLNAEMGGVAIATGHGSVLIECAKRELHATTSLIKPDRFNPSRISLVFYQHKNMNYKNHGAAEYSAKEAKRNYEKAEKKQKEKEKLDLEKKESQLQALRIQNAQQNFTSPYLNGFYQQGQSQVSLPSMNMATGIFKPRNLAPNTPGYLNPSNNPPRTTTSISLPTRIIPQNINSNSIVPIMNSQSMGKVVTQSMSPLQMPGTCATQSVTQSWSHPPNISRNVINEKSFGSLSTTRHLLQQSVVNRKHSGNSHEMKPLSEALPPYEDAKDIPSTNQDITIQNKVNNLVKPPTILGQFSCYPQSSIYQTYNFQGSAPNQIFYPNIANYPNHMLPHRMATPQTFLRPRFLPPKTS